MGILGKLLSAPNILRVMVALVLIAFVGASMSCGGSSLRKKNNEIKKEEDEYVGKCRIPNDQSGTFIGKWPALQIPLAFKKDDFSDYEMSEMVKAATTWNEFYVKSHGFPLFDFGDPNSPALSNTEKPGVNELCNTHVMLSGNTFVDRVIIYKSVEWPKEKDASAIALTTFCSTTASPINRLSSAMIDYNYQNFFVGDGAKVPDLQSIQLHELGHVVGLAHSCEGGGVEGIPECSSSPQSYLDAVMYPAIYFDDNKQGLERIILRKNDMERSNCLYEEE